MPLFHEFAARLPQSGSANEKQGEPKVIAVAPLILLGQKIRGRELRHGGIRAID
jgi:hypothetical protein